MAASQVSDGAVTVLPRGVDARWSASVSSVLPSPFAPKSTLASKTLPGMRTCSRRNPVPGSATPDYAPAGISVTTACGPACKSALPGGTAFDKR